MFAAAMEDEAYFCACTEKVCATRRRVTGALRALGDGAPDASGTELDAAIAALGELDGRSVSEAVVAEIFSRFCVGK